MVTTLQSPAGTVAAPQELRDEPGEPPPVLPPALLTAPLNADTLVAQAMAAGSTDPRPAAERLLVTVGRSPERLGGARSILIRRLQIRSDDLEATLALRIIERAVADAPDPDGPWCWPLRLSPGRIRAPTWRRARAIRRAQRFNLTRRRQI
jgi:hypothetical protein